MRKEINDYIGRVLFYINDKDFLPEVTDELLAHIEDRTAYYTDSGYDPDEAERRAIEHMGNPRIVGEELNQLYDYKKYTILGWLMLALCVVVMVVSWVLVAFVTSQKLTEQANNYLALSMLSVCFCFIAAAYNIAFVSRKRVLMFCTGIAPFVLLYFQVRLYTLSFIIIDNVELGMILNILTTADIVIFFITGVLALVCSSELNGIIRCTISEKVERVYSGLKSKLIGVSAAMLVIHVALFVMALKGVIQ